jgi:phosphoribosylformylglycinamidine synthase I
VSIAVVRFPGTNNDKDVFRALSQVTGANPYLLPSRKGIAGLKDASGIVIPGGFSYGDYLRPGAVASVEAVAQGIRDLADDGTPILGIANGFQILTEMGMLPGVLLPNSSGRFVCRWVYLHVSGTDTMFTEGMENAVIRLPIAHAGGNFYCSQDDMAALHDENRVPLRYCDSQGNAVQEANPTGSLENIAGVINQRGNILGLMPHPERACRQTLGSADGLMILENFVRAAKC